MQERGSKEGDEPSGITRRTVLKAAAAIAAAGLAGFGTYHLIRSLTPKAREVKDTFIYTKPVGYDQPVWFDDLLGQEARIGHFEVGMGANAVWKAVVEDGHVVPYSGFPALLIRLDESSLQFPAGYAKEEFVIDGLYAIFNCCTHACCLPVWKLVPRRLMEIDPGFEPVYCACHAGFFDPRRVEEYEHPTGVGYIGVAAFAGPPDRGMPLIPIELDGDKIVGRMKDPWWYRYLNFR